MGLATVVLQRCNSVAGSGVLFGIWSIVAPFGFAYDTTVEVARNTDVVIGVAVALIAVVSHFLRLTGYAAEGHRVI